MVGFSRESEHQQKKRDDLSSILHASSHDDDITITKFVVYFFDCIAEHGVLLLRFQTANEECLVMITPTMNDYGIHFWR